MTRRKARNQEGMGAQLPPYEEAKETGPAKTAAIRYPEDGESAEVGGRLQVENNDRS